MISSITGEIIRHWTTKLQKRCIVRLRKDILLLELNPLSKELDPFHRTMDKKRHFSRKFNLTLLSYRLLMLLVFLLITFFTERLAAWGVFGESLLGRITMAIPFFVALFVLIGYFFYCIHYIIRKLKWRIACGGILFVWALISFTFLQPEQAGMEQELTFCARVLTAFHDASTLFFVPSRFMTAYASEKWVTNLYLLQAAVVLYVGALLFSTLGRSAFNRLRILLSPKKKIVFWGLSERELLLARSIIEKDARARIQFNLPMEFSYDPVTKVRLTDLADDIDAVWCFVDFTNPGDGFHAGKTHFLLGTDGHANLAMANRIVQSFMKDNNAFTEIQIFVRAGDTDNSEIFTAWAKEVYTTTAHLVKPVIIREAEMIARMFAKIYMPIDFLHKRNEVDMAKATVNGNRFRTLLIGFDQTGRELLNMRLAASRFIGKNRRDVVAMPITVVDMKKERWDRYAQMSPEIVEHAKDYGLDFLCMQVGFDTFEKWFDNHYADYDCFVFCLPGDDFNIREAMRIRQILIQKGVTPNTKELIVRVADPSVNEFARFSDERFPLQFFGNLAEIYSIDYLDEEPIDRIAKVLNWQWNVNQDIRNGETDTASLNWNDGLLDKEQRDDIERLWEDASYYNRLSSRASALGSLTIMRLLGYQVIPRQQVTIGMKVCEEKDIAAIIERNADVLARIEHLRWCTYIRASGNHLWNLHSPVELADVVKAKLRQTNGRLFPPNNLANQVKAFQAHAALVDYDELPHLDLLLAQAVDNKRFSNLTDQDFVGQSHLQINERLSVPSMQCKDYDMVQAMSAALKFAGFCLVEYEEFKSKAGNDYLVPHKRLLDVYHSLRDRFSKWWQWFTRKTNEEQIAFSSLSPKDVNNLYSLATWINNGYQDSVKPPTGYSPMRKFLDSKFVEWQMPLKKGKLNATVFCFADSISSYSSFSRLIWRRKNRYPYVFIEDTGLILPFSILDSKSQKDVCRIIGVAGRRIDFESQPNFVAQIVCGNEQDIMVQFRGSTGNLSDWVENLMQWFGRTPPQHRLAADLIQAVCETSENGESIHLVGHSKGGGEVQYSLMRNVTKNWRGNVKLVGTTFNTQRLSPTILERLGRHHPLDYANEYITNYRVQGDLVSGMPSLGQVPLGKVFVIGKKRKMGWLFGIWDHKMTTILHLLEKELKNKSRSR